MIHYILRLITALILSAAVGYERERQDKPAGLRDTMLVCLGAALCAIMSLRLKETGMNYDVARILSYTIASIGFLGSGVIIHHKGNVEGVTTAALLWTMVTVGLMCGLGEYVLAIVATVFVYGILKLKHLTDKEAGNGNK